MHAVIIPQVLLIVLLSHPVENYRGQSVSFAPTVDTSLHFPNLEDCSQAKRKVADALASKRVQAVVECIPLKLDTGPLNRPRR